MKKDNFKFDSLPDIEEEVLKSLLAKSKDLSLFAKRRIKTRINNILRRQQKKAKVPQVKKTK